MNLKRRRVWVLALAAGSIAIGCGAEPAPEPAPRPARPTIATVKAAQDENLLELSAQVAWFCAANGRLPASLDEVAARPRPDNWPPAPRQTSKGLPIAYQKTGPRQFQLVLPRSGGKSDTGDATAIPYEVPASPPGGLTPDAFRLWWHAHCRKGELDAIRDAAEEMLPPGMR
jgi:hypothetical protein